MKSKNVISFPGKHNLEFRCAEGSIIFLPKEGEDITAATALWMLEMLKQHILGGGNNNG